MLHLQVFTWHGCRLEMAMDPATDQYLSDVVELAYVQPCTQHAVADVPSHMHIQCRFTADMSLMRLLWLSTSIFTTP